MRDARFGSQNDAPDGDVIITSALWFGEGIGRGLFISIQQILRSMPLLSLPVGIEHTAT
jgi:hypothetical protein